MSFAKAAMTKAERTALFGQRALQLMADSEEWNSDFTQELGELAINLKLAKCVAPEPGLAEDKFVLLPYRPKKPKPADASTDS